MPRTMRVAALASAGLLAALCITEAHGTRGPTARTADADHPTPLARFYDQHPVWRHCPDSPGAPASYQCATITVPLDYAHPDGTSLRLRISRLRTSTPAKRHGVLLSNPGGPGDLSLGDPVQMKGVLAKSVLDRYDLIGFDPRGLGTSSPLQCGLNQDETDPDESYLPVADFARAKSRARDIAAKCVRRNGRSLLPYINTRNTARDMDVIRGVLDEKKISYLGWSYGSYLGAVYTQLFPRRSDRMVLDSAPDPNHFGRGADLAMAAGVEPAFEDWSRLIARRDSTYHLGTTPEQVRAAFWQLIARADHQPLLYQGDDPEHQGEALTGAGIRSWLRPYFAGEPYEAAHEVAALRKARPTDRTTRPATSAADATSDNSTGLQWAIMCADNTASWPRDPARYQRDARRESARHPLYGDFAANIAPCAFWPRGSEPATHVDNTVSALVVHNQWDPQTPLSSGLAMHRALHGSRLVHVRGGRGHTVYGFPSAPACVTRTVDAYLTHGRLPATDVTCSA